MQEELGARPSELFSKITPEPVAAASLGQVYRATLRETGESVALKVQRPGCLELVALDLVLGRRGILIADKLFPRVCSLSLLFSSEGCLLIAYRCAVLILCQTVRLCDCATRCVRDGKRSLWAEVDACR
jgi:hypothetical protein